MCLIPRDDRDGGHRLDQGIVTIYSRARACSLCEQEMMMQSRVQTVGRGFANERNVAKNYAKRRIIPSQGRQAIANQLARLEVDIVKHG